MSAPPTVLSVGQSHGRFTVAVRQSDDALQLPKPSSTENGTTSWLSADEPLVTLAVTVTEEADDTADRQRQAVLTVLAPPPPSEKSMPQPPPPPPGAKLSTIFERKYPLKTFT